uniref:OmpA-like domain-containing protein n=1 Tax=Strongyloides stercoralis TaxID=6248 RepID=A0A0K0DWQ1_STRER
MKLLKLFQVIFYISIIVLKSKSYKFICDKPYYLLKPRCILLLSVKEIVFRTLIFEKIYPQWTFKLASNIEKERYHCKSVLLKSTILINRMVSRALMSYFTESLLFNCNSVSKIILFRSSYDVAMYRPEKTAKCINNKLTYKKKELIDLANLFSFGCRKLSKVYLLQNNIVLKNYNDEIDIRCSGKKIRRINEKQSNKIKSRYRKKTCISFIAE